MHRIVSSHLNSFTESNGIQSDSESIQFEKFANFSILSSRISSNFDLEDVTTGEEDDGTDGIALIINEEHILSKEDAKIIFSGSRRHNDVEISFIQAKRSEGFDLGDFLKFKESILRFLTQNPYHVESDLQTDARKAFDIVIDNVTKIRNGKPSISAFYVSTGKYNHPEALETSKREMITQLDDLGLFHDIDVQFIGRDELIAAWVSTYSGIDAKLELFSTAPLPQIDGIEESYLGVASALDYVENLLLNEDGSIRTHLFEENVRHFLGSDNPVNEQIKETLQSEERHTRFPVLNNGITIVSPDVRLQGNILNISNCQIVNGCQTSHVLYNNRDNLQNTVVTLKIVETTDEEIFSDLVRATNSQSKIGEEQFFSLSPISKSIEAYFNTFDEQDGRLYFERRDRQYVGKGIPAIRIVSLQNAAKCVCSMFLRRPDLAFKFQKRMYNDLGEMIFNETNKESIYYASSLALYRFHLLTSNNTIPSNMRRFKWHILPLVASIISGKDQLRLNSRSADRAAQKIIDVFSHHGEEATNTFEKAVDIIQSFGSITNDRLKRQAIFEELFAKLP